MTKNNFLMVSAALYVVHRLGYIAEETEMGVKVPFALENSSQDAAKFLRAALPKCFHVSAFTKYVLITLKTKQE
jgi:hypothetical protein